jgi:hypothetical protein
MLEGNVNVMLIPPDLRGDGLTQFLTAGQAVKSDRESAASEAATPPPMPPELTSFKGNQPQ